MKKITITLNNNVISFKYRTKKLTEPNLLNTNIISNNELTFSDEYLQNNVKLVGLFFKDLVNDNHITEIQVSDNELALLVFDILKEIPTIEKLTIINNVNLSYTLCEAICKSKNIKALDCYGIPEFMIESLDKNGIAVNSRNEVLFTSEFMLNNDLTSFSKMYYKNSINISENLSVNDIDDIKTFLSINKYLKVIHFDRFSVANVKQVVSLLLEAKRKNISLQIHDDLEENQDVSELKDLNKKLKSKYKINISLVYSKDYLEKNYLPQIIFTTLKVCAIIIFVIITSVLGYVIYNKFQSEAKVNSIMNELNEILDEPTPDTEPENEEPASQESPSTPPLEADNAMGMINSYNKLYEVNKDMAGWLTVRGTKVNYPVVRANNNSYYLERNFYKEKDYNGWVFMDYRNNIDVLDDNTIIYAHNRYVSGVMFGTLTNIEKSSWLKNKNNYKITFNTLYKEYTWQIFSYYSIDVTSDYLIHSFSEEEKKQEFFDKLRERSEHDFDIEVTKDDKILTLSTCLDNNKRFVVHAVLTK